MSVLILSFICLLIYLTYLKKEKKRSLGEVEPEIQYMLCFAPDHHLADLKALGQASDPVVPFL